MNEANHYYNQLDARKEGLEEGRELGREEGREEDIEIGHRKIISLLLSLPDFASADAVTIAARTGIDLGFVLRVMAELAEQSARPRI